jgi:hypothetical protein
MRVLLPIVFISFLITGCSSTRFVEPLEKDQLSIGAGFGGPTIEFAGAPIPLPLTSIEVGYGLDSNLTIHGGWHTTAAFFGNAQIDAGVTYQFIDQNKYIPNVSVSPSLNFIYSFDAKAARLWPILDLNAYWNYGKRRNYFYVGFNNYFEMRQMMANEQEQMHHWIFNPQIGHVIKGKKSPWQFSVELKLIAPYLDNTKAFVPYKSVLGKWGSTGFYLGFRRALNFKK